MTRGHHLENDEVKRALGRCPDHKRDIGGGWHPKIVAENLNVSPSPVRKRLQSLAEEGCVVAVDGVGPTGPRVSYLPADHPDVGADDG